MIIDPVDAAPEGADETASSQAVAVEAKTLAEIATTSTQNDAVTKTIDLPQFNWKKIPLDQGYGWSCLTKKDDFEFGKVLLTSLTEDSSPHEVF